ncbi:MULTISPECIES: hypothetical protein [Prevotella]|uniref:hypothetical protein n=1 Tax=Prevotella herbatica TaxID=2801997 RepID=UPI001A930B6B|nr:MULTISPECIES: hypothetical protein [Prevotella]MDN5554676.1 hypothetical protein [Prevotella sp.]
MKKLFEAIVRFLISDIPIFAKKNGSIQSRIKNVSVNIFGPSNPYRDVPSFGFG